MEKITALIRMLRPADWVKNIFVLAPLFFTRKLFVFPEIVHAGYGVLIFCMAASSIYILNDLKDRVADRLHPIKRTRALASETIKPSLATGIFFLLSIISLICAFNLSLGFFYTLIGYFILNLAYIYRLKNYAIIDVFCISAGFVLRVVAGAVLISVEPTVWILVCTWLLALFLALAKRRDDFVCKMTVAHRKSILGYNIHFIDTSIAMLLGALLIAYTIYTTQEDLFQHLGTRHFYFTVPFVLLGMLRYLQITLVEERSGSPTTLLLTDKFLLVSVIGWTIVSAVLMY